MHGDGVVCCRERERLEVKAVLSLAMGVLWLRTLRTFDPLRKDGMQDWRAL